MDRNLIVKMKFGSHLYGLNTPFSDLDYKGIYFPTMSEILTCQTPKSETYSSGPVHEKNSPDDVDFEAYSLHYFLSLAAQGETVALDMLHAPKSSLLISSPVWQNLQLNREKFYTKQMKSFVGYARKQAAKYGIKGTRLRAASEALTFLISYSSKRLCDVWHMVWENDHCHIYPNYDPQPVWEVCGKKLTYTALCSHYIPMLEKFVNEFGVRARLAEQNEGVDWKAMSHALRAAFQVRHILQHGGYTYPLPETQHILQVKQGGLDFKIVAGQLEELINQIEQLTKKSKLSDEPDFEWMQDFLETTMLGYIMEQEELIPLERVC